MNQELQYELENSCAGRPIKSSMHSFSADFLAGCKKFSELAKNSNDLQEITIFNTSCIINAACFLEAKMNEEISIGVICHDDCEPEGRAWRAIQKLQKKLTVQEKWDLVVLITNGKAWDRTCEPFQSFETIASLRNELVHFKATFLGKDEAPTNKIGALMKRLGISSQAEWIGDECSNWVTDLLGSNLLGDWIYQRISQFNNDFQLLVKPKK